MPRLVRVVRNVEFNRLFDAFFISAISTILLIRFYLSLTGYPQIGGSTLHFSHLLPGTILLLAAFLVLLAAVNRAVRNFAAIVGGVGFGFIWDELGKFITKDNNYFFKATPGLIYLSFVVLFLLVRRLGQRRLTADDYLANVLDLVKDSAVKDLDVREYEHALELMHHVPPSHNLYHPVKRLLESIKQNVNTEKTWADRLVDISLTPLHRITGWRFFSTFVAAVAFLYGLTCLLSAAFFFIGAFGETLSLDFSILRGDESDVIGGISTLASGILVGIGLTFYLQGKKRRGYRYFELALLINILVGQVVLFFKNSSVAILWLAVTLFLLINMQILVAEHKRKQAI
jgi:hypothetical protein